MATHDTIEGYLRAVHDLTGNETTFYGFVTEHGRYWEPQALPEEWERGAPKECFSNSQSKLLLGHFLSEECDLTYVEGYAISASLVDVGVWLPIHHGWLVDGDGRVIDVTWDKPADSVYFGVPFRTPYVKRVVKETGLFTSLIDNMAMEWPLLDGTHTIEESVMEWKERVNGNG